jgi:hypothetical protein
LRLVGKHPPFILTIAEVPGQQGKRYRGMNRRIRSGTATRDLDDEYGDRIRGQIYFRF